MPSVMVRSQPGRYPNPLEPPNDQQSMMLHHHTQTPGPSHYQSMNYGDYYGMGTNSMSPEMGVSSPPNNVNSPGQSPTNLGSPYGPETPPPAYR